MAAMMSQLAQHCDGAVGGIQADCDGALSPTSSTQQRLALDGCGHDLVSLLSRQAHHIADILDTSSTESSRPMVLSRLDDIISIAYAKFYAFLYKDLPVCWRQLYTDASILKFCYLLRQTDYWPVQRHAPAADVDRRDIPELKELVRTLDLAVILAGAAGESRGRRWVDKTLDMLYALHKDISDRDQESSEPAAKRLKTRDHDYESKGFSAREPFTPPIKHPIDLVDCISMEEFQAYLDKPNDKVLGPRPLVIRGALEDWPARNTRSWSQPANLLSRTFDGLRLVPVEVGRSYVDEGWGQKLTTFAEFLQDYIDPSLQLAAGNDGDHKTSVTGHTVDASKGVGYLAQHPLFTQLPALRNDILTPDYCYTAPPLHPTDPSMDQPELESPLLNAWFGPPGTITPLHTDPYHNILAQVVGRKYVRLYSPLETERMQGRGKENGVEMGNTSLFDVGVLEGWDVNDSERSEDGAEAEMVDQDATTAFKDIPFVDCILEPGDALYIPIGWWHYVRGLSVSFSVSFWWN